MKALLTSVNSNNTPSFYHQLPENIICFSHLRWDFVFQRPQQILTRFSKNFKIVFIEEPIFDTEGDAYYNHLECGENLQVMIPHLPKNLDTERSTLQLKGLFDLFVRGKVLSNYCFWYYTPMALEFSRKHQPELIVYDCMDELSAFKFAPESLKDLEKELLKKADIVFTGGQSLYQSKKNQHSNIHPIPSSIDRNHFESARKLRSASDEKMKAAHLTLGFYGVIDERFDIELIRGIAGLRANWQIKLIGPIVKIDPQTLPKNDNIHYLGPKSYQELPSHLASWDYALIPFLLNESTRFISPTKTPEYLAAGVPVISTPIRDVIDPYGKNKLVSIGRTAEEFVMKIEERRKSLDKNVWQKKVDDFLMQNSWDNTCSRMLNLMSKTIADRSMSSIAQ
ncbi:MAG: glycosyltransferase family 1 protein [Rhodoferax sp.]|nr:glycosyltransferase family 1 protein [Rhodoferax sp.]